MKIKFIMLSLAFGLLTVPVNVLALPGNSNQTDTATQTESASDTVSNSSDKIRSCDQVEIMLQNRFRNYAAAKNKFTIAYANMISRLHKFVARSKEKGFDTAKLEADISILDSKINNFSALAQTSETLILQSQQESCGQAQGQFIKTLNQARQQVKLAHKEATEIRAFYREVIRVDLQEIKTQNANAYPESPTSETSAANQETEE